MARLYVFLTPVDTVTVEEWFVFNNLDDKYCLYLAGFVVQHGVFFHTESAATQYVSSPMSVAPFVGHNRPPIQLSRVLIYTLWMDARVGDRKYLSKLPTVACKKMRIRKYHRPPVLVGEIIQWHP